MTRFTEDIMEALTDEWQTTTEVSVRTRRDLDLASHKAKVRHHLRQLYARGKVERRIVTAYGVEVRQWRRRQ